MIQAFAVASLVMGCGGEGGEFEGAELDDAAQTGEAINRGTLMTANGAPFSSIVRLGMGIGFCSGVKISETRYLTAAHCTLRSNCTYLGFFNKVDVSNALDATGTGTSITLDKVYVHPSYKYNFDSCDGFPASEHSYDVAILETVGDQTPTIPKLPTALYPDFLGIDTPFRQVGYGENVARSSDFKKKQSADYRSVSDSNVASYAHTFRTFASQSAGGGDSGGALLYETSPGSWRVAGLTSAGNGSDGRKTADSYFTRLSNVAAWIAAPHNDSTTNDGTGFFQSFTFRQCMRVTSSAANTPAKLSECEGYNPTLHGQLWQVVANGSYFSIRTRRSNVTRCLDIQGATNNVVVADCNNASQGQQWTIAPFLNSPATRTIKNRLRNLYLSDTNANGLTVTPNSEARWLFYR